MYSIGKRNPIHRLLCFWHDRRYFLCVRGEIGRRTGFKPRFHLRNVGSSPAGHIAGGILQMITIDMNATGKKLKEMRKKSGMTIKQIQEACGISAAAVCKWQNGQAIPSLDNLLILSHIWNVKIDDLIIRQEI